MAAEKKSRRQQRLAKLLKRKQRQRIIIRDLRTRVFSLRNGLETFRRMLKRKERENLRKCANFKRLLLKKMYFQGWLCLHRSLKDKRDNRRLSFERNLQRNCLDHWDLTLSQTHSYYYDALEYYELKLAKMAFEKWLDYVKCRKGLREANSNQIPQ